MRHPFERIPPENGKRLFLPLLAATLLVVAALGFVDASTRNASAPQGIVSFELARSVDRASAIVNSWDASQRLRSAWGLGFDYLFMPLYSSAIGFACVWAGRRFGERSGRWLAWGMWVAAGFDAVENFALLRILLSAPASPWPQLAFWCASIKFGLILIGLAYAGVGAVVGIAKMREK